MTRVLIKCPQTGHSVFTGIDMSPEEFERAELPEQTIKACAACGQKHVWSKSDATLES
jgi:hypothetical protein